MNNDLIEWIQENIHKDWSLSELLKNKIGIHHGALPRHVCSTIVDNFNSNYIQYLFCTSTLIEGVNTSAKNVVLFDKKKGKKPIDFFDFKNISGRAGRFNNYFIGNVFNLEKAPEEKELDIDIPFITQDDAPIEILINIDEIDLTIKAKERLKILDKFDDDFKNILKKHSSLPIEGLIKIKNFIEENIKIYHPLISWTGFPKYIELLPIIELAWNNLLKQKDSKAGVRSFKQLTTLTIQYGIYKNIKGIINYQLTQNYWIQIEPDFKKRVNKLTYFVLNVQRYWFDYKLPKLLISISDIQEYIFNKLNLKIGDYKFYATEIENSFLPNFANILKEYNIPLSIIKKMDIPESYLNEKEIIHFIKNEAKRNDKLNKYEHLRIKNL